MLKFKQYINEVLSPEQDAEVSTWPKRTIKATRATDPYFGRGNEDKIESIGDIAGKSDIHQAIEKHLNKGIEPEEYKEGKMKDSFGRKVRIGAVLGKTKAPTELARGFENDPTRQAKSAGNLTVRTTRSASGVAGQTSGDQSWSKGGSTKYSCKDFVHGCNKKYLPAEVRHGVVASYLHDENGKEIARASFAPYHNDANGTMYKQTAYYGVEHAGFMEHNKQTEAALSGEHKGGSLIYNIHPKVYDNENPLTAIHPNVSEQQLTKTLATGDRDSQAMAAGHPKANAAQISAAQESNYGGVALAAMRNPNANTQHIERGLNDTSSDIRSAAIEHPKATTEHIERGLNDVSPVVRMSAARHPNATSKQISRALSDERGIVRQEAMENPNINAEHITKALSDPEVRIRSLAMKHPAVTPEHINKALDDDDCHITTSAAMHPNATAENLTKAMNSRSGSTRRAAVENKNATNEHITRGLDDTVETIRNAAIKHRSASAEQLTKVGKTKEMLQEIMIMVDGNFRINSNIISQQ